MSLIVAAYNAHRPPFADETAFRGYVDAVLALPAVTGLELPYQGAGSPWQGVDYLAGRDPGESHVVTMVGAALAGLERDPAFGLASRDDAGRRSAVDGVLEAFDWIAALAERGVRVSAIELHSAPRADVAAAARLAESLAELAPRAPEGVALLLEHCDALVPGREPAKGFLPLAEELALARELGLGVALNWGRSAVESRDAEGPQRHVEEAVAAGLLRGLVFSGAGGPAGPGAWADNHLPLRDWAAGTPWSSGAGAERARASLLTREGLERALEVAAGAVDYLGVKISLPGDVAPEERLAAIARHVELVAGRAG